MTCDYCGRSMNYTFYINDAYWIRVVGEEKFDKNVGHVCAHCTLERLSGLGWYIIWNEPTESIRKQHEQSATTNNNPWSPWWHCENGCEFRGLTSKPPEKCPVCRSRKIEMVVEVGPEYGVKK